MINTFKPMYRIGHAVSRFVFQNLLQAEAYGIDHIPTHGPFLLACNHASFLDPFVAGCFFNRDIYFFARKSLFKPGLAEHILNGFNAIPVDRASGKDISALKRVFELLRQGQGVLIFLEGTRSLDGTLQPAKKGIGLMACKAQVPIIPTHIIGSFEVWGRSGKFPKLLTNKIAVIYGPPLYPKDYDLNPNDPNRYQNAADIIRIAIAKLKEPFVNSI